MRRNATIRIAWAARLARGRENARLSRALDSAAAIRDTQQVAGALIWDRDGRLTILRVIHHSGRRTVEAIIEPRGEPPRTVRGLRAPGLARIVLQSMGFLSRR